MIPPVAVVMQNLAISLMTEIGPQVQPDYQQKSLTLLAMLLLMAGEEWDRSVARRVEENAELRRIFGSAAPSVEDDELRARLERAASEADESLLVSDLDRSNDALRELLIALHERVESLDTDEARRIEAEIWSELCASTERRKISASVF
jgi:hypothetical protein